jgi:tetratricopeptide (TPR) repeat protein
MHDGVVLVADGRTGELRASLRGHADWVACVAISPDGARCASASADRTVRVWNLARAAEECTLEGHEDAVVGCEFSPCGRYLLALGRNGAARVWPARLLDVATARNPRALSFAERDRLGLLDDDEQHARRLVDRLSAEVLVRAEVEQRLSADPALTEPLRAIALRIVRQRADRPWRLEREAWLVVRDPGSDAAAWADAARRAEAACALAPGHARFLRTLGGALCRVGRFAEAEEVLEAAVAAAPELASAWAFLAIVRHRLGRAADAAAAFAAGVGVAPADGDDALRAEVAALLRSTPGTTEAR